MAVSLITLPNVKTALYSCITFVLNIDDIGIGDVVNKIGYQLLKSDNTELTPLQIVDRKTIGNIAIDVAQDLYGLILTSIPRVEGGENINPVADDNFIITIKLKYGNIAYNNATGIVTNSVNQVSSEIEVFHSALQRNESNSLIASSDGIYSHRPFKLRMARRAIEYIWLSTLGTYDVMSWEIAFNNSGLTQIIAGPIIPAGNVVMIPLRPKDSQITAQPWRNVKSITVRVGVGELEIYRTDYFNYCAEYHEIMFLDPLGGRGQISFEQFDGKDIASTFTEITRRDCIGDTFNVGAGDYADSESVSGDMVLNKKAYENMVFVTEAAYDSTEAEYFKYFLASPSHHVVQRDANGDPINVKKFNLVAGAIRYYDEHKIVQMRVSGKIAHAINVHPIDR